MENLLLCYMKGEEYGIIEKTDEICSLYKKITSTYKILREQIGQWGYIKNFHWGNGEYIKISRNLDNEKRINGLYVSPIYPSYMKTMIRYCFTWTKWCHLAIMWEMRSFWFKSSSLVIVPEKLCFYQGLVLQLWPFSEQLSHNCLPTVTPNFTKHNLEYGCQSVITVFASRSFLV